MDRDPLFTEQFASILAAAEVKTVKLPAKSPKLNAYAERFVRSIRRVIPLGEEHLRNIVSEYVEYYHVERNYQGLGNELIDRQPANRNAEELVKCRERLGGTLRYYYRDAA